MSGRSQIYGEGKPRATFMGCCQCFGWVFVIFTVLILLINTNACGSHPTTHYDNTLLQLANIALQGARSSVPVLIILAAVALSLLAVVGLILAIKKMEATSAAIEAP